MSFPWAKFLDLAHELAQEDVTSTYQEGQYRSAISRAYYAAFHKARLYLADTEGFSLRTRDVHSEVANRFLDHHHPSYRFRRSIGVALDTLRQDRNIADYTDDYRVG
jgi:uncharacterized protein (UPF0332 family)